MVSKAPRKKVYRTMQGRYVDIEKLRAANESVRAIGNMSVNARGDVLGPGGAVVKPKSEVMQKYYEQPRYEYIKEYSLLRDFSCFDN